MINKEFLESLLNKMVSVRCDGNVNTARVCSVLQRVQKWGWSKLPRTCHATTDDTSMTTNDECIHNVDDGLEDQVSSKKRKQKRWCVDDDN